MESEKWIKGWLAIVATALIVEGALVYKVDPYMHFHKPNIYRYYYDLDNQRSQNDGMTKHLDYDAMITGTSMTANFRSTEMDEIFSCNSIKVPFFGASYKEINDNIRVAIENNPDLKIVVRGLDPGAFITEKNKMSDDMGEYPAYLYDSNPFNDVEYIWNRDVIYNRVIKMINKSNSEDSIAGMTSFDDYSNWHHSYTYGINTVCPGGVTKVVNGEAKHLSDEDKEILIGNIEQNVVDLAKENPQITFYYFISPYSVAWWKSLYEDGSIYRQIEAEKIVIEKILECDNIKLFSINNRTDIIGDLNNYKDIRHYGQWINSLLLKMMHDGKCQLTKENYESYIETELKNYTNFDYYSLNNQVDYESDFYAAALLNAEYSGKEPISVLDSFEDRIRLNNSVIVENQYNNSKGIDCVGTIKKSSESDESVASYILNTNDYVGAIIWLDDAEKYDYLTFCGKKIKEQGQPSVYIINSEGSRASRLCLKHQDIDNDCHQYVIDISKIKGDIRIIFNGGYTDETGNPDSEYIFSNIYLY